jgi:hypothetical protein
MNGYGFHADVIYEWGGFKLQQHQFYLKYMIYTNVEDLTVSKM